MISPTAPTEIKEGLTQLKIRKLAPDYVKKLRADQQVEIQDANLKSQDEQIQADRAARRLRQPAAGAN